MSMINPTTLTAPLYIYGKPRSSRPGVPRAFDVVSCHSAIRDHPEAMAWLKKIVEGSDWRSNGGEHHPSCFAAWPLAGDDWLVVRFLDDGRDDHGRPHTLRLEAALCRNYTRDQIGMLLDAEAWPSRLSDEATVVTLNLQPTLSPPVTIPKEGPLFRLYTQAFDCRLLPVQPAGRRTTAPNVIGVQQPSRTFAMPTSSSPSARRRITFHVFGVLIGILLGGCLMMGHYTPQLEQKTGALKDMERKLEGKDGEIDLLKKDKGEVESERDELKKQLEVADQQAENRLTSQQHHRLQRIRDSISRLEKVMAPIEAEIKNLAHDISPARDDGPQSSTEPKAQLPEEPRLSHTTSSPSIFGRWK